MRRTLLPIGRPTSIKSHSICKRRASCWHPMELSRTPSIPAVRSGVWFLRCCRHGCLHQIKILNLGSAEFPRSAGDRPSRESERRWRLGDGRPADRDSRRRSASDAAAPLPSAAPDMMTASYRVPLAERATCRSPWCMGFRPQQSLMDLGRLCRSTRA